jgi:UDP-2,3-diacylglucosamine hydrolase
MEQDNRIRERVYLISDVHLDIKSSPSDREDRLMAVFDEIRKEASHLYIVGDLFDFWFEYKYAVPAAYLKVVSGLLDLTRSGVKVFYIPGNHDFWMRDFLSRQAGVVLTDQHHEAVHFDKRILITHGDGLRKDDVGYRFMKRVFRNRFCIWLYSLLPVDLAYRMAMKTSSASRSYTSQRDRLDSTDYVNFAKEKISEGYDSVIMGHVHKPEIIAIRDGYYVNCGDFFANFSYVVLNEDGFQLKSLTSP